MTLWQQLLKTDELQLYFNLTIVGDCWNSRKTNKDIFVELYSFFFPVSFDEACSTMIKWLFLPIESDSSWKKSYSLKVCLYLASLHSVFLYKSELHNVQPTMSKSPVAHHSKLEFPHSGHMTLATVWHHTTIAVPKGRGCGVDYGICVRLLN